MPTFKKGQKPRGHSCFAPWATIRLATLPSSVRLPAKVLDAASTSHSRGACSWVATHPRASITKGTLLNRLLPTTEANEKRLS